MKHISYTLLLSLSLYISAHHVLQKNTVKHQTKDLTISLIIPCDSKHAIHLYPLLQSYEYQTCLPHDVVISLSELENVSEDIIYALRNTLWAFPVTLICSNNRIFAGANRNRACKIATGDIFLCQDADDLAHPQRVEIIKYFFEHHDIVFLMHECKWLKEDEPEKYIPYDNFSTIKYMVPKKYNEVWSISSMHNGRISTSVHNGNIAITKQLFKRLQWPEDRKGQDVKFNQTIFNKYNNRYVIRAPLVLYRNFLSSWLDYYNSHDLKIDFNKANCAVTKKYKTKVIYKP